MNREAFEAWAVTAGMYVTRDPDDRDAYMSLRTEAAWHGWQAREQYFAMQYTSGFEPQELEK
jgi:hypothetical protein